MGLRHILPFGRREGSWCFPGCCFHVFGPWIRAGWFWATLTNPRVEQGLGHVPCATVGRNFTLTKTPALWANIPLILLGLPALRTTWKTEELWKSRSGSPATPI